MSSIKRNNQYDTLPSEVNQELRQLSKNENGIVSVYEGDNKYHLIHRPDNVPPRTTYTVIDIFTEIYHQYKFNLRSLSTILNLADAQFETLDELVDEYITEQLRKYFTTNTTVDFTIELYGQNKLKFTPTSEFSEFITNYITDEVENIQDSELELVREKIPNSLIIEVDFVDESGEGEKDKNNEN